jgi:hypothetical protein
MGPPRRHVNQEDAAILAMYGVLDDPLEVTAVVALAADDKTPALIPQRCPRMARPRLAQAQSSASAALCTAGQLCARIQPPGNQQ